MSNTKFFHFLVFLILSAGIFLRFYGIEEVYSEYDDIGVVSLHHTYIGHDERTVLDYKNGLVKISVDGASLKEKLIGSILYPVYIGFVWTYPPGQYLFTPLLLGDEESYISKLFKSRLLSAIASSLSLITFAILIYLIDGKNFQLSGLTAIALLAFSNNLVLYSHHAGPYSTVVLGLVVSMLLYFFYFKGKISLKTLFFSHGLIFIFNYLIILMLPIYVVHFLVENKNYKNLDKLKELTKAFFYSALVIFPIWLIFFKSDNGMRGLEMENFPSLISFFKHLLLSLNSSINGFFINENLSSTFVLLIIILSFKAYFTETNILKKRYLSSFLLLLLGWVFLYYFGRLPIDSTRHMLFWSPVLSITLYMALKNYDSYSKFFLPILIILSIISFSKNIDLLNSKKTVFDFKKINESNIEYLYTYSSTLSPLIAFKNKKVFNLDVNSFAKITNILPRKALLVSQNENLNQYLRRFSDINDFRRKFLDNYSIKIIKEKDTGIFFPFNNNPVSSNQNGFYLYELNRKK